MGNWILKQIRKIIESENKVEKKVKKLADPVKKACKLSVAKSKGSLELNTPTIRGNRASFYALPLLRDSFLSQRGQ